jgi:prepilin-type N-terminal cleavage/methylation domain-containing protein
MAGRSDCRSKQWPAEWWVETGFILRRVKEASMQRSPANHGHPADARRGAFTLVELMIVIVIIGALMALTAPALMRAFGAARDTQVRTEISQLETAINAFKTTYGVEPPSRIVLCQLAVDWDPVNTNFRLAGDTSPFKASRDEISRSRAIIRRIWPQFDFSLARDLNGPTDASTDPIVLNAAQCLTAFLGGVRENNGFVGFAKNPVNPFATGGAREGPFFEFRGERVVVPSYGGFPVYLDPLPGQTRPYLYFSSYEGRGYRPLGTDERPGRRGDDDDGVSGADYLDSPTNTIFDPKEVGALNTDDESPPGGPSSVYLSAVSTPHKQQSFQIISPGNDTKYGAGGLFEGNKQKASLATRRPAPAAGIDGDLVQGVAEYDNITNIHGGRLFSR